jgi:hypothetical protein
MSTALPLSGVWQNTAGWWWAATDADAEPVVHGPYATREAALEAAERAQTRPRAEAGGE